MGSSKQRQVMLMGVGVRGVVDALLDPDVVLRDFSRRDECRAVVPDQLYPLDLYLDLVTFLSGKLSRSVIFRMGESVGRQICETGWAGRTFDSPAEAIAEIQLAHEAFCRPTIGTFEVTRESVKRLRVDYAAPYDCVIQEGLFHTVTSRYGGSGVYVRQTECRKTAGGERCRFLITHN